MKWNPFRGERPISIKDELDKLEKKANTPVKQLAGPESDELKFDYIEPNTPGSVESLTGLARKNHPVYFPDFANDLPKEARLELLKKAMTEVTFSDIEQQIILLTLDNHTPAKIAEILAPLTPKRKIKGKTYEQGVPYTETRIQQILAKCIRKFKLWYKKNQYT